MHGANMKIGVDVFGSIGRTMLCKFTFEMVVDPAFLQHPRYGGYDCMDFVHVSYW